MEGHTANALLARVTLFVCFLSPELYEAECSHLKASKLVVSIRFKIPFATE